MKSPGRILKSGAKGLLNPPRIRGASNTPNGMASMLSASNAVYHSDLPLQVIEDFVGLYGELKSGSVVLDSQGRVCEILIDAADGYGGVHDIFFVTGVEDSEPLADFRLPAMVLFAMR